MTVALHEELDALLVQSTSDWLWAAHVFDVARRVAPTDPPDPEALIDHAVELVEAALTEGLLVPGRIAFGRFVPWELPTTESVERIRRHWWDLPYLLGETDFAVWFAATPEGLVRARLATVVLDESDGFEVRDTTGGPPPA